MSYESYRSKNQSEMKPHYLLDFLILYTLLLDLGFVHGAFETLPVGFWIFNEAIQGKDLSGNQNDAILKNVTLVEGPYGENGAYKLAGTPNSFIRLPNNGALNVKSYTILMQVMPGTVPGNLFQWIWDDSWSAWATHVWIDAGLYFRLKWDPYGLQYPLYNKSPFAPDQWFFVAASYDLATGEQKLWKDGKVIASNTYLNVSQRTFNDVIIGLSAVRDGKRYWDGKVACYQLYNRALNQEEILEASKMCSKHNDITTVIPYPHTTVADDFKLEGNIAAEGTEIYHTITTASEYNYIPIPNLDLTKHTHIRFSVKACNDAHLNLLPDVERANKSYELVIGGWENTRSVIRENLRKNQKASTATAGYLDCSSFQQFWISWDGGNIMVGRGKNVSDLSTVFMIWRDPHPYDIRRVRVSTGWGSTGIWHFYKNLNATTHETRHEKIKLDMVILGAGSGFVILVLLAILMFVILRRKSRCSGTTSHQLDTDNVSPNKTVHAVLVETTSLNDSWGSDYDYGNMEHVNLELQPASLDTNRTTLNHGYAINKKQESELCTTCKENKNTGINDDHGNEGAEIYTTIIEEQTASGNHVYENQIAGQSTISMENLITSGNNYYENQGTVNCTTHMNNETTLFCKH